jgi:SpoVK/Ycf46/Vps4 family AAA+-type ATPase
MTLLTTVPTAASHPVAGEAEALLADLGRLDERLHTLIDQIRAGTDPASDPDVRGLIIEEGDVDRWLGGLGEDPGMAPGVVAPFAPAPGGRLARLGALFGLDAFDLAALLTALAPEIDLSYANLYAYAQDDVTRKHATVDLALSLWCNGLPARLRARQRFAADAPLRRHGLLTVDEAPAASLLTRPLALDPRIAAYLLGADQPDASLAEAVQVIPPTAIAPSSAAAMPPEMADHLERIARVALGDTKGPTKNTQHATRNPQPMGGLIVWLRGADGLDKRAAAEGLAAALGRSLLVVDCPALIASSADPATGIARALREARLQGGVVFWAGADILAPRREETVLEFGPSLTRPLAVWSGCALFDIRAIQPPHLPAGPVVVDLEFPAPGNERRHALWTESLAGHALAPDVDLDLLSGAFRLTGEQIAGAAESAIQAAAWHIHGGGAQSGIMMRDLVHAARAHSNQGLGFLARKIIPRYTWADLVLPPDRLAQLHEMCNGVRVAPVVFEQWGFDRKLSSGKGVNVLFAGQPGTGKTMAAEVLASDLGLDLYKIDLSAMVSKYIGETEKNLEKIFREGRTSNAILFFDEADSIFGKRSEVKDSHDRYANMEISYLLQRMEEYDGIVILATNLRKIMDEAFIRRIRGAIEFPMPEEPDRLEIWRRTFPPEAPLAADVDLAFLARTFKFSGGNIKNIVLEAAFLAAEAGTAITMAHMVHATRREHQKTGRLIAATDFGPYSDLARRIERVT